MTALKRQATSWGGASASPPRDGAGRARDALLWTAIFAAFIAVRLLFHEMWRDELNSWAGPVESDSLADLFAAFHTDGHGFLWETILYAAARLSAAPAVLQALQGVIATALAWVVLRFAPLPPWPLRLLVFGYTLGFEFAVIARPYALGALAVATAAVLLARPRPLVLAAFACLAAATNTTVYGLMLALALAAGWGVSLLTRTHGPGGAPRVAPWRLAGGAAILLAAVAFAVWSMVPPPDSGFAVGWNFAPTKRQVLAALSIPWRAFFPLPPPGLHFWNGNVLAQHPRTAAWMGLLIVLLVAWAFRRRPGALTCWLLGAGGVMAFSLVKYGGSQRHHAHVFLAFLAAAWLASALPPAPGAEPQPGGRTRWRRAAPGAALWAVLLVQLACGLYASWMDLRHPFSASGEAAAFLVREGLDRRLIVADFDTRATPVLARLGRPRFLYARGLRTRMMIRWDRARLAPVAEADLIALVHERALGEEEPPVLLTSYPLSAPHPSFRLAARFPPGIVADETYFVYLAQEVAPP